ncbi:hypothetical protein MIND_00951200 [Mycena indigotica]|uniref:Uncharacterized protein n=1 Tax=Mycena indigotica TaxID=2126181 RepID=A0A8H6VZ48_9AGAR|nr:uncharacterized protein MIND_00951200 [Mycena indigotica]KAF7297181.1 hypothetical protein MIND_00951200 [Mycena indigotica]
MVSLIHGGSLDTNFPVHDACFGDSSNLSSVCQVPSTSMITFLNITNPSLYLDIYCNNPPDDSCAFGYCPNPDVASPAVRYSTYFTSLVSAILVLYSPADVTASFFAQLLNVYSLVIAAIVSIAGHNLTKLHSVIALTLASSPLSLYLIFYVVRSMLGKTTRLQAVFGPGMHLNRAMVLLALPLWVSVLVFTTLPTSTWHFNQAACDTEVAMNHIASLFFLPFIIFFVEYPEVGALIVASVVFSWGTAIWRTRAIIWAKGDRYLPLGRRKVVERYPFIQFYTVIVLPHLFWMTNVEYGISVLDPREHFSATYGQLLAIFVTVPSFIQLCCLLPRVPRWFSELYWVRSISNKRNKPYYLERLSIHQPSLVPDRDSKLSVESRGPWDQESMQLALLSKAEKSPSTPSSPSLPIVRS